MEAPSRRKLPSGSLTFAGQLAGTASCHRAHPSCPIQPERPPPPPPPPRCPIQLQAPASARVRAYPPLCQGRAVLNVGVGFGGKKGHHAPDYLAFRLLELARVSKGSSPHFLKSHLKIKGNPQNTNKNKYYQKKLKGE